MKFIINILPEGLGFSVIKFLANKPPRPGIRKRDREALAQAQCMFFGRGDKLVAWTWGKGPIVVFVHGWGGRGSQMAPLALHMAERGFQSVVFDVTGHGASSGRQASFRNFISDIGDLTKYLNREIYAFIGHSAGGLCMMAARELEGIKADHYVCISSPRYPYPPIQIIRKLLGISDKMIVRCKKYYSEQFRSSWESLEKGHAYADNNQEKLLLIYDESDTYVAHTDGDEIQRTWPTAKLVKTQELGHYKILISREVEQIVEGFLRPGNFELKK
ncbi:alpha/beta hydrolase [Paremcibacter congregatus]|nr:alpha/beta hydrolase [Paremcibacter congregatus]